MKFNFWTLTGKRKQNEDAHNMIVNMNGAEPNLQNINFYAIYDGHGGKFVSKFLSKHFPRYFLDKRISYPLKKDGINRAFQYFQNKLKTEHYKNAVDTGSTCLIVIQYMKNKKQYLNIMNAGDCRAVIAHDNFGIPLSKDHKPANPEETHRITQLGGKIVWDGYDYRIEDLSVSRAFGDISAEPYVTCKPDIFEYVLSHKDKFIIMGCDGLWDVMENQEAVDFVLKHCYDIGTGKRINKKFNMAKRLAERAIEKGSGDNVSVIVVFLN